MMVPLRQLLSPLALGIGLVLLAGGCEETVDPTLPTSAAFTLFGHLDPTADTQAVRVFPLDQRIDAETDTLPGRLTSTALPSGDVRTWQDSLVTFADGTRGIVTFAPLQTGYDRRYRLRITRPDGSKPATVTVTTPTEAQFATEDPVIERKNFELSVEQTVQIRHAPRLREIEVHYFVNDVGENEEIESKDSVIVPYQPTKLGESSWSVTIHLRRDALKKVIPRSSPGASLRFIELHITVLNEEWDPPGGDYDLERLIQPGAFSNVENGFGFVGAGYRARHSWIPPCRVIYQLGYKNGCTPLIEREELTRHWVRSFEEESERNESQIYRPKDFKDFPDIPFRPQYIFHKGGELEYLTREREGGQSFKSGTWRLDSTKTDVIHLDKGDRVVSWRVLALTEELLHIKPLE